MTHPQLWRPIEDYTVAPSELARTELRQLAEVWTEQRGALEDAAALEQFNQQLRRSWAIETGLLERLYTLDRGVTQLLVEKGIDAALISHQAAGQDPERIVAILRDHQEAVEGLFDFVKGDRPLSTSYVKELHALLTRHQLSTTARDAAGRSVEVELLRGEYKRRPNNPTRVNGRIHEYCPPEQVATEMEHLIALHLEHQEQGVEPEVEAAWLHHRFTQIHPFQDGNGRVARCLATLVFIRSRWFPLVIRDTGEERSRYLDALESADRGDLEGLVEVFAAAQRRAFVQALGISGQVLDQHRTEQVIAAARQQLEARRAEQQERWQQAKDHARQLAEIAHRRFADVAQQIERETGPYFEQPEFFADREAAGGERDHYFRWQVVETAKTLGYFANLAEFHAWERLVLHTDSQAEILVSLHGAGHQFRGLVAVSACFFRREESADGERQLTEPTALSNEVFQVNYLEPTEQVEDRFTRWLEEILVKGLEIWREGL